MYNYVPDINDSAIALIAKAAVYETMEGFILVMTMLLIFVVLIVIIVFLWKYFENSKNGIIKDIEEGTTTYGDNRNNGDWRQNQGLMKKILYMNSVKQEQEQAKVSCQNKIGNDGYGLPHSNESQLVPETKSEVDTENNDKSCRNCWHKTFKNIKPGFQKKKCKKDDFQM